MSTVNLVLAVALGVAVAVVYPTLIRFIRKQFPPQAGIFPSWVKAALKKYGGLFAFSILTAGILVATYRSANPDTPVSFWSAVAMGFGFESSIEKIIFPKTSTGNGEASGDRGPSGARRVSRSARRQ